MNACVIRFLFWRLLNIVNAKRLEKKLPSLLVDDSKTNKKSWNSLMRMRYRLKQLKKKSPERYSALTNRFISDFEEIQKAVSQGS